MCFVFLFIIENYQNTELLDIAVVEGRKKIPYPLEVDALYSDDVSI